MQLDTYDNRGFSRGKPRWVECLWLLVQWLFIRSQIPGSAHRRVILRLFGARIGNGVTIKPGLRVKFPWRLTIGSHSWLGEDVWIDNLADVSIGSHCCLSQDVYLCTGNHDWSASRFDLRVSPIIVGDRAWIAARAIIAPGVTVREGSILALGSVATKTTLPWTIHAGNPAEPIRARPQPVSASA